MTAHNALRIVILAGLGVFTHVGCADDASGAGGNGGPGGTGGGGEGGTGGADESTSCADALDLQADETSSGTPVYVAGGALSPAGDRDFWTFEATAGEWIQVTTSANPNDDPTRVDTVIRLYDAAGDTLLATGDDAFPRVNSDSELFHRLISGGTYCLEVLESADWRGGTAEAKPNPGYSVQVLPIDFDALDSANLPPEPNDLIASANTGLSTVTETDGQFRTRIAGLLDPSTDEDWLEVTMPANAVGFTLNLTPSGTGDSGANAHSGFGATVAPNAVSLFNANGVLIASVAPNTYEADNLGAMIDVPVTPGQYYLQVTRPSIPVGANDFYFFQINSTDTVHPQEGTDGNVAVDTGANDSQGGAETAQNTEPSTTGVYRASFGGLLPEGDVDWWTFNGSDPNGPEPGRLLGVSCKSQAAGSGVRAFTVTFTNGAGTQTRTGVEDPGRGVVWSREDLTAVSISEPGPYFIRVENVADGGDPGTTDTGALAKHYLCELQVAEP